MYIYGTLHPVAYQLTLNFLLISAVHETVSFASFASGKAWWFGSALVLQLHDYLIVMEDVTDRQKSVVAERMGVSFPS